MKNTVYGYCRISTLKQKLQRQIDNIKAQYPDAVIITEEYTGTTTDRPNWNKLYKKLAAGDTVVFDEVSRMSRNAEEGFKLYEDLFNRGVNLIFLKERHIDTDVYREALTSKVSMTGGDVDVILQGVNEYLMILAKRQIEIAFKQAQAEVDFLRQRTAEGVKKAQERYDEETIKEIPHEKQRVGRQLGSKIETKKAKEAKDIIKKHSKDFNGTLNDPEVMKLTGLARNTYYKYKRELK